MESSNPTQRRNYLSGGMLLIGLGVFFLLAQIFDLGVLALPLLAGAFLVVGVATRASGWFIPAGILAGISLGAGLIAGPFGIGSSEAEGGVFLLAFALGWASIPLLAELFTRERQRWAFVPAGAMALIGAVVLGAERFAPLMSLLPYLWPAALIGAGLVMLLRRRAR